jgi:hypothetical protein
LSYFYGFIGLKCQVTDCMFQRLGLLIERIHFCRRQSVLQALVAPA